MQILNFCRVQKIAGVRHVPVFPTEMGEYKSCRDLLKDRWGLPVTWTEPRYRLFSDVWRARKQVHPQRAQCSSSHSHFSWSTYLPYETVPLLLPPKENLDYRIEALMKLTPQAAVQIKPRSRRRLSRISIYTVSGCRKTLKGTTTECVCKLGMNKAAVQASCENNNKKKHSESR